MDDLIKIAQKGIRELTKIQKKALGHLPHPSLGTV
jgi:hypothetical protein